MVSRIAINQKQSGKRIDQCKETLSLC